jgi:hypothetical protein
MTKSLEIISEAIRNPKHPFRKVDNQPKKPLKASLRTQEDQGLTCTSGNVVSGEAT